MVYGLSDNAHGPATGCPPWEGPRRRARVLGQHLVGKADERQAETQYAGADEGCPTGELRSGMNDWHGGHLFRVGEQRTPVHDWLYHSFLTRRSRRA